MSIEFKLRRGTTAQHSTFTGAEGEVTVDTTKDTLVVHDGVTPGGKPVLSAADGAVGTSNLADDSVTSAKIADGAVGTDELTGASVTVAKLGSDVVDLISLSVPAGIVAHFASNTAPSGWLKANGAAVSRTTYASLFAIVGTTFGAGNGSSTFNLPDLRGEFIRGWDDGRGVDSGRSFGSAQLDQMQRIQGSVTQVWANNAFTSSGSFSGTVTQQTGIGAGSNHRQINVNFDSANSSGARTGSDTRPRNVAILACIKY